MDLKKRVLAIGNRNATDGRKDAGQGITPISQKKRCEGLSEPTTHTADDQSLQRQADKNEQIRQRCSKIMQEYQENIRRCKSNRPKLLNGIRAGEPAEEMLILATGIISDMTGDEVYRKTAEQAIQSQYMRSAV